MSESTAITTSEDRAPVIRSLILQNLTLEGYQAQTLAEARERVQMRQQAVALVEAEVDQAEDGLRAAVEVNILEQQRAWRERLRNRRNVLTRRRTSLARAQNFLQLVEEGYLPVPRLESAPVHWLRDPLPPPVLRVIGTEEARGVFTEFRVVGMEDRWAAERRRGRDPILVGVCDGEMFPLAWWR